MIRKNPCKVEPRKSLDSMARVMAEHGGAVIRPTLPDKANTQRIKNSGKIRPRKSANRSIGVIVDHGGTVLTFRAILIDGGRSLKITPGNKMDQEERTIKFDGKFPVEMICPSVEGTVLICLLASGKDFFCDTLTGKRLTVREIESRIKKGECHFYH